MSIQNEIDELEAKKKTLIAKQKLCRHSWGTVNYNPYTGKELVLTGEYEEHGVHRWPKTRFEDVTKDRWTRTCETCGLEQHTEKQDEVKQEVKYAPRF
jgi:hypothetical protein